MKNEVNVADIITAKTRGYITSFSKLSEKFAHVVTEFKTKSTEKQDYSSDEKSKEIVQSLEILNGEFEILSKDIEGYSLRVATLLRILDEIGEPFEPKDEIEKEVLKSLEPFKSDSVSFFFGVIDDEVKPLNEENYNAFKDFINKKVSEKEFLEQRVEFLKSKQK